MSPRSCSERVKKGRLQTSASNALAGDPAFQVVKELHLDYVLDGKAKSAVFQENQTIRLPDDIIKSAAARSTVASGKRRNSA